MSKLKRLFVVSIIAFFAFECIGQSLEKKVAKIKGDFDTYHEQINEFELLRSDVLKKGHTDSLGLISYSIGNRKFLTGKYLEAPTYLKEAINSFNSISYDGYRLHACYYYLLQCYNAISKFEEAISLSPKIKTLPQEYPNQTSTFFSCIVELAKIYTRLGDYDVSISELKSLYLNPEFQLLSLGYKKYILLELSGALYRKNSISSLKESLTILKIIESLYEADPSMTLSIIDSSSITLSKAQIALRLGNNHEAAEFTREMINQLSKRELIGQIASEMVNNSRTLAIAYRNLGKEEESYELLKSVESHLETDTSLTNLRKALFYQNLAVSSKHINRIEQSKKHFESIFELIQFDPDKESVKVCINEGDKTVIADIIYDYIDLIIDDEFSTHTNSQDERAIVLLNKIDTLLQYAINDVIFDQSKISLKKKFAKYYATAIDLSVRMNDVSAFLNFSEKNQNLLILESRIKSSVNSKSFKHTLDSLKNNETELVYMLKNELLPDTEHLLSENRKMQVNLNEKFRNSQPLLFNIDAQKLLLRNNSNSDLIYYQFGMDSLYALHINRNNIQLHTLGEKNEIASNIEGIFNNIIKGLPSQNLLSELYNQLILPIQNKSSNIKIVPTEFLSLLPFEMLIDKNGDWLIESTNITYTLSLQLDNLWKRNKKDKLNNIRIVSPKYNELKLTKILSSLQKGSEVDTFPTLKYSQEEAKYLQSHLPTSIVNLSVSKKDFFSMLANSDIFHFTGHSVLDKDNNDLSFLALGIANLRIDSIVTLSELKTVENSAELVYLNACNTGRGEILEGEGVYNLSRAFFIGGSKSVINSLWEIDDESSKNITLQFYDYLSEGLSKSSALRQAKLDYIHSDIPEYKKHPYYWAGLVLVGNDDPVKFKKPQEKYIAFLGLASIVILLGIPLYKFRHRLIAAA